METDEPFENMKRCPFCGSTRMCIVGGTDKSGHCYACFKAWTPDGLKIRELRQQLDHAQRVIGTYSRYDRERNGGR